MAEEIKGFAEHWAGFTRHWKLAATTFAVILLGGVVFTISLKDIYQSTGFILIEEASIPEEIIRSTVTTYTTRQVTELNERILTIGNLVRIIEEYDLYPDERKDTPTELLALNARQAISIEIQSRETVTPAGLPRPIAVGFTVSFDNENPEKAQAVTAELVDLYLKENVKARAEQTSETSGFLKGEVARLEGDIGVLETKMARFKEEHADTLPSMAAVNKQQMNRLDAQILEIQRRLNSLEQTKIEVKAQLNTVDPSMPSKLADGSMVVSPADQLKSLQTQLSGYESRYSDDHPDVIRTKRDIESLRSRFGLDVDFAQLDEELVATKAKLAIARERYSADHPDVVALEKSVTDLEAKIAQANQRKIETSLTPDNPAYISLQTTLHTIDAEEDSLKAEVVELERRMADYEQRIMIGPQTEKDLASLTRELSSTANRYWVMRDKQFTAEMGETLETQSKGEEMVVLEPPRVPLVPYKPDRPAILMLTLLFAVVCGVAVTQLADALDHSIRGAAAIENVQGQRPLVEIPYIYSAEELERTRRLRKIGLAAAPAVAIILAVIVHFTVMPLDVLFFRALRGLGL